LTNFESGNSTPYGRTLRDIQIALEPAGVEFIEGGVRLKSWTTSSWSCSCSPPTKRLP